MLSVANVATPATAARDAVPESVPPPGLVPMATVTLPVKVGSLFPKASCAVACTAGVIVTPAVALLGGTVNTRCVAAPAAMLKAPLVLPVRPVAAALSV